MKNRILAVIAGGLLIAVAICLWLYWDRETLSVTPEKLVLDGAPGQKIPVVITVKNDGETTRGVKFLGFC